MLWALVALLLVAPARGVDQGQRLAEIQREIEEREARARSYAEEAQGYFEELDAIDRELTETRRSVRRLRKRQREAEKELETARTGLAKATRALEKIRKDLENRLVALYKFGTTGGIPALYSAQDFQSFARRRQGLARVLEQDTSLFDRHRVASTAWARSRDRSQRLVAEIRGARREIELRNERVRRDLVERRNLVALLRSRSEQEQRAADELRQAARRLEEALARMPAVAKRGMIEPERVVEATIAALAAGRREVTVPRSIAAGYVVRALAPSFMRRSVKKVTLGRRPADA